MLYTSKNVECYNHYQRLGLSPIGSESDAKRPLKTLGRYGQYRAAAPPHPMFDDTWRGNIQLMLGQESYGPTKIVAVDLDGEEAKTRFARLADEHSPSEVHPWKRSLVFNTWVAKTPSGGEHYYFLVPDGTPVMSKLIWLGDGEHEEIRLLGEGKLAMAPPSTLDNGAHMYIFQPGCTPRDIPLPMLLPQWISDLPPAIPPRAPCNDAAYMGVSKEIPNKLSLAIGWGLRVLRGGCGEWVPCRVPWREDRKPSGRFNVESGVLKDFKTDESISFLALAVELGAYHDIPTAMSQLVPFKKGLNVASSKRRADLGDRDREVEVQAGQHGHGGRGAADRERKAAGLASPAAGAEAGQAWWEVPARVRASSSGGGEEGGARADSRHGG